MRGGAAGLLPLIICASGAEVSPQIQARG